METRSTGYILVALQSCVETTLPTDFFYIGKKKREKRKGAGWGGEKEGSESILYNVLVVIPPVNTKTCFTGI